MSDGTVTEYEWDHRNRLTSVTFKTSGGTVTKAVQYEYDAYNRLVTKKLDADGNGSYEEEFHWIYDGNQAVLQFDGDTAADLSHRYLWSPAVDQLLADETVDDGGAEDVLWPLGDWQGSVRHLAGYNAGTETTTVANEKFYDAYGNVTSESNSSVDTVFGWTGRFFDEDTGLQWNLNRWYDPVVGRWLSEDPIGFAAGDPNLFRYTGNSPADRTDPTGLDDGVQLESCTRCHALNNFGLPIRDGWDPIVDDDGWVKPEHEARVRNLNRASQATLGVVVVAYGGGYLVASYGWAGAGSYLLEEAGETLFEEATGIPVIVGPDDLAEALIKKGVRKEVADQTQDAMRRSMKDQCTPSSRTFRDANGRLRNADGTFAPDGGRVAKSSGTHGNTAGNQPATLYERYDADGNFLKHGVSQDPSKRYTQKELDGGYLIRTQTGSRREVLKIERELVETTPGPLNKEPWAGKRAGE